MRPPACYFDDADWAKSLPHHGKGVACLGPSDGGEVFECLDCGLVFSPKTSKEEYIKLYSDPGRYFKTSVSVGYHSFEERYAHDYAVGEVRLRNLIQRMRPSVDATALDVGCGNCALIARLREIGLDAYGADLDSWSVNRGLDQVGGAEIQIGDFLDLQFDRRFGVVLFTDSFEHFLWPSSYVRRAISIVAPKGMIVIETPDTDCDDYRKSRIGWRHVKPREHPFLYQQHHIESLFGPHGFKVIDVVYTIPGRAIYYLRAA